MSIKYKYSAIMSSQDRHIKPIGEQGPDPVRRRLLTMGGAVATSLLIAPGIVSAQSRRAPKTIQVGYLPANTILMVFNQGADIWRQAGVNLKFVKFHGGPQILNAVASGSIPVAGVGVGPALLAAMRGAPIQFFTLGSVSGKNYPFSRIMVRKDSDIRTFTDLEGRTLALHQRGTMEHISLSAASAKYGLPIDKIKISLIPFPNQPQVLAQKQVDAIYTVPPFDTIALRHFGARTLVETIDFMPYLGYSTLAVHNDFLSEYPEAVNRILKGWIRFSRWVNDNNTRAKEASGSFLGLEPHLALDTRVPYYVRNGLPILPNIWHIYYMYVTANIVSSDPNITSIINKYFIDPATRYTLKALDEVGREPDPVAKNFLNTKLPLLPSDNHDYFAPWERSLATGA